MPMRTPTHSYTVPVEVAGDHTKHRLFDDQNPAPGLKAGLAARVKAIIGRDDVDDKTFFAKWNAMELPKVGSSAPEVGYIDWAKADKFLAGFEKAADTEQRAGFKSLVRSALVAEYGDEIANDTVLLTEFFGVLDAYSCDPRQALSFTAGRCEAGIEMIDTLVSHYPLKDVDGIAEITPPAADEKEAAEMVMDTFAGSEIVSGAPPADDPEPEPVSEPEAPSPEPEPIPSAKATVEAIQAEESEPEGEPEPSVHAPMNEREAVVAYLNAQFTLARELLLAMGIDPDAKN